MSTTTTVTTTKHSDLNVSLEDHLIESLSPLSPLLPQSLSSQLQKALEYDSQSPRVISHSLLSSISSWARSADGLKALTTHSPALAPADYTMIALLAGTCTSPERKFPSIPRAPTMHEEVQRGVNDRRAVVAILNALLSILGAGVATWVAAGRLAWKDEWRVLLALLVAMTIAISEGILYLIWDARRSGRPLIGRPAKSQRTLEEERRDDGDINGQAEVEHLESKTVTTSLDNITSLRSRRKPAAPS